MGVGSYIILTPKFRMWGADEKGSKIKIWISGYNTIKGKRENPIRNQ